MSPENTDKLFLQKTRLILIRENFPVFYLHGFNIDDLKARGLRFKIAEDLEEELRKDRSQNYSHRGQVAIFPGQPFLSSSNNLPLANQDTLCRVQEDRLRRDYWVEGIGVGISRFADYGEIILQCLYKGMLLKRDFYPYLAARTRTRVFPDDVGSKNYVVHIGPFDDDGLCVDILSRDEGDPDVGVLPLIYSTASPFRS